MSNSRHTPLLTFDGPKSAAMPFLPAHFTQSSITRTQIIAILRAHMRRSILIALGVITVTAVVVKLLPKSYTAQTTVLVNYEANDATRQAPAEFFASYMLTQVELMQGRAVLTAVIDKLGLENDPEYSAGYTTSRPGTKRDWVLKTLARSVSVEQGKGIQLLYLSAKSEDRNKAALVANTLVDAYEQQERERIANPGGGRANEYSEQLADLQAKVTAAEGRVSQFRIKNGISDISALTPQQQVDNEGQVLTGLEQQLLLAQNQRRGAEAHGTGDQNVSTNVMASVVVQNLKAQLSTLQAQLAQVSSTLGPQHPKVLELESQISAARRSLNQEIQTLSSNSSSELESSKQLEGKLQHAVDDERAKILRLRNLQDEGSRLQLELESAQNVYKRALEGVDQTIFASSSTVSRATPPIESDKPNKMLLLLLGVVAGIALGLGLPLYHELFFSRRLRCREDMERDFGIPVLAEFDPIATLARAT